MVQRLTSIGHQTENLAVAFALLAMSLLPVLEMLLRGLFNLGIPGSIGYVQNLTLWVGFLGAIIASRERRHLNLSTAKLILPASLKPVIEAATAAISVAVSACLFWASLQFVMSEMADPVRIGGWLPLWCMEAVLPLSFLVITLRFVTQAGRLPHQVVAVSGIPLAALVGLFLAPYAQDMVWPGLILLLAAAVLGAPIFVALGGTALVLFFAAGVPIAAIPVETYRIVVSPAIPSIPLFTLTGFLLAESGASQRLLRLFQALFGWMPGGLVIVTTLVCAFFATFTGASGVGILALGGLLLPILLKGGLPEGFSLGLLTATGSIGLLFPPSLAVILYGVVAHVPIPDLFMAGLVPGALMVGAVILYGLWQTRRAKIARIAFDLNEAGAALWTAKWEILLPVVILAGLFGGLTTLIEAAAVSVAYTLTVATVIHREIAVGPELLRILVRCASLVGGVFAILGIAMGVSNYMVDAQIPMQAAEWVAAHVDSKIVFLLALNFFLLLVGCLMDLFSAIVVVVPLLLPIGQAFGIHPLHLGMIFLVNLELGYLTPPVGLNLFLAAYRFERPVTEIYRCVVPFLLVLLMIVLAVTYLPWLILGL
jgi:tripartite ATP-independent transporter DctM subunit